MGLHHYKIEMQLRDAELNQSDELKKLCNFSGKLDSTKFNVE